LALGGERFEERKARQGRGLSAVAMQGSRSTWEKWRSEVSRKVTGRGRGSGAAGSASSSSGAARVQYLEFRMHFINDCDQSCIAGIPDQVR
jgi:hypothetical protein